MNLMIRAACQARGRLGHRGAILLALGIFDEIYALGIPTATITGTATSRWLAFVAPLPVWAAVWAVAGVVLIAGAFAREDGWAYFTAIILKFMWGLVYLLGWAVHGVLRGWVSAATWTLLGIVVLIVSTWPERQWPAG